MLIYGNIPCGKLEKISGTLVMVVLVSVITEAEFCASGIGATIVLIERHEC